MPGLGTSFGRGGATDYQQDLMNSDCIVIMGSNMAENHPVGFQWVLEARERGAKVIHVDPRFTRTSAMATKHVGIRAGSDIAFLGGIVNYILENDRWFDEYVKRYTNAPAIIGEEFADTEDLDGLFSGWDPETGYDQSTWSYEGAEQIGGKPPKGEQAGHGGGSHMIKGGEPPEEDETLQHPRCVFQILKRHYTRYTPEFVADACGCTVEEFLYVAESLCDASGPERTGAFAYAVGWTQHTVGVQIIRTAAIIQLLLGNIGRPGGGIMALRGHASIQGSTDIPTLYNTLPGYIDMPHIEDPVDLGEWLDHHRAEGGWWHKLDAYLVSLLKAWWGPHATAENDYCFDYLPRIDDDNSNYWTVQQMLEEKVKGYVVVGQNPAVGSANGKANRLALAKLDWLVVRDFVEIETAAFWYDSPEIESGELRPEEIGTEVFFMPAAAHTEKDGSFTNTQRLLQWHYKAVDPKEDCRSELWFYYHLGRKIRERLAESEDPKDRPLLDLQWNYPTLGQTPGAERRGRARGDQRPRRQGPVPRGVQAAEGRRLDVERLLDLLRRIRGRRQPGGPAQAALGAVVHRARVGLGVAGEPAAALQPRVGRPRRQPVVRAQEARLVGRRAGQVDGPRHTGFRRGEVTALPPRRRRERAGRDPRRPSVHHAVGRPRLALRAAGPRRTARCRRTTSRRSRRSATSSTGSAPTRRGRRATGPRIRTTRRVARRTRTSSRRTG